MPQAPSKPDAEKPNAAVESSAKTAKEPSKEDLIGIEQFTQKLMGQSRYSGTRQDEQTEKEEKSPHGEEIKVPAGKKGEKPAEEIEGDEKPKPDAKGDKAKPAASQRKPNGQFKPRGKAPEAPVEPLSTEQLADAIAQSMVKVQAALKSAEPEKKPELPNDSNLDPDEQYKLQVLDRMEKLFPTRKGTTAKYRDSMKKLETYVKAWKKEHPGEDFDESDPRHSEFFDENDVEWKDSEFRKAELSIAVDEQFKENNPLEDKVRELSTKLEGLNQTEERRKVQHLIQGEQCKAARVLWKEFGEDFADMVDTAGNVNMEKLNEMRGADEDIAGLRLQAGINLDAEVETMYALYNGLEKTDVKNNAVHRNVNAFALSKEQQLMGAPKPDQLDSQGREFLPAHKYYEVKDKATRESRYWTFTVQDLALLRAKDLASIVNRKVDHIEERHRKWAQARGIDLDANDEKPRSPSLGGGAGAHESRMAAQGEGTAPPAQTGEKAFAAKFVG